MTAADHLHDPATYARSRATYHPEEPLMVCQNCRSSIATARYAYGHGALRNLTVLCDPCAGKLLAIGMDLRAGRSTDHTLSRPVEDRRPAWVRNLRAKDFTGSIA